VVDCSLNICPSFQLEMSVVYARRRCDGEAFHTWGPAAEKFCCQSCRVCVEQHIFSQTQIEAEGGQYRQWAEWWKLGTTVSVQPATGVTNITWKHAITNDSIDFEQTMESRTYMNRNNDYCTRQTTDSYSRRLTTFSQCDLLSTIMQALAVN